MLEIEGLTRTTERGRLGVMDGLRGVAVLLVVFSHISNARYFLVPGFDLGGTGKYGVWLFFVLSAFLLTTQLDALAQSGQLGWQALLRYAITRVFRIFPLYLVALLWSVASSELSFRDTVLHALLLKGVGVFWTIPVEFKYYLLIPVVAAATQYVFRRNLWALGATMIGLALAAAWFAPPSLTLVDSISLWPYLAVFFAGSFAAIARRALGTIAIPGVLVAVTVLALIATIPSVANGLIGLWGGAPVTADAFHPYSPLYGVAWAIVLLKGLEGGRWSRYLSIAPLRFVGRVSFSLYLIHVPVLFLVAGMTAIPIPFRGSIVVVLSTAGAAALFWAIERPGIRAGLALANAATADRAPAAISTLPR